MHIRSYTPADYQQLVKLYQQSDLYGGQFDENRDGFKRLQSKIQNDPDAILVAESDGSIVGTVSLIDDGRVAWLFRFAVIAGVEERVVTHLLSEEAMKIFKERGHTQVLVYTPTGNENLYARYNELGFTKGNDYTCFWKDIN